MPYLTLERLVDDNGEVDPVVYRHMVRRRCLNEYGVIAPRTLRPVIAHYQEIIRVLVARKQEGRYESRDATGNRCAQGR